MRVTVFTGDIADAPADVICTSTNARLSLMMGTGGSVRERGGFEILRECEALLSEAGRTSFPVGSVHRTTAGKLPYAAVIHCIASDPVSHISSPEIIRSCVRKALADADALSCKRIAMPVFATGHARMRFDRAVEAIAAVLHEATTSVVEEVVLVVEEEHRAKETREVLTRVMA
jgi:O-acetyl-ADP-ribose deacetylase (regulator of RNase III)